MSRQTIDLGGATWRFGQVPRRSFTAPDVYDAADVREWLPATVPGNVRTDLLALGRIPDPFFGEDYKQSLWVEDVDWWYRCEVRREPLRPGQRAFLIFEGVDYLSAIFVNGRELARHEGMFSRQIIEVTGALQAGVMEIAVRLWGSGTLPTRKLNWRQRLWQSVAGSLHGSWTGVYPDRSATLKCQMSFGWDFAPPIRTMGIWDEASLVVSDSVFIREARVEGRPRLKPPAAGFSQAEETGEAAAAPAQLTLDLILDSDRPQQIKVVALIRPANFQGPAFEPFYFFLDLLPGQSQHTLDLRLAQAALWQPWDRGQPHLYEIDITIAGPASQTLDQISRRTGFRTVELRQWQFYLNGRREFIRGLNWVPADSLPGRLRRADYERLLAMVRACNANLLRVWGGGLREKQAFYDLCDERGILVWQEFPFACMFLGSYPRHKSYLKKVETECRAIVRQLSDHPSLAVWCGGNEFSRRRNRPLLRTLAQVVHQNDRTRPFIPVSPSHIDGGDAHNWLVWHGDAAIRAYQVETARFLSEFGLQALPHLDTLQAVLPDPTRGWESRQADPQTLARYAAPFRPDLSDRPVAGKSTGDRRPGTGDVRKPETPLTQNIVWKPKLGEQRPAEARDAAPLVIAPSAPLPASDLSLSSLPALIAASQQAQAAGLQTAIEHMRRRKGEAGGVCLWQFNEPWPAISWAIVDYFGRPKAAYERLADWYNLLLITLDFPVGKRWRRGEVFQADIWAINDSRQAFEACRLQIDIEGRPIHIQQLSLPGDSVQRLGRLRYRFRRPPHRLTLVLYRHVEILACNSYDLDWHDPSRLSLYRRFRRWAADWALR